MPSKTEQPLRIIVVMGVSGCGKTSVGAAMGGRERVPFLDGDDYHPQANVEKMRSGQPLDDDDRWPWLAILGKAMHEMAAVNGRVFAACSALKRSYREALREAAGEPILFLHLDGSPELIGERMAARMGHYMPTGLLDSQLATLEPPADDEFAARIAINQTLEAIQADCEQIIAKMTGKFSAG